jgi:hypothetical protein
MTDTFDGDAIARADRDFLATLGDHPLARHPLYSIPCPPPDDTEPERAFAAALSWMLINYGYYAGAFGGKGGIISLVDGKITTDMSLRKLMLPYAIEVLGPNGGRPKLVSVVDTMLRHPSRMQIDGMQARSDKLRPTFEDDGEVIFNRYWPPAHPKSGGEIETFKAYLARLVPDDAEREWFWNYLAHKTRKPWVPMVALIMVAEEFGSGRGTLYEILNLLFGQDYVVPCSFGELTGSAPSARFNARMGDALFAVVNEAVTEDGHQQARRRLDYEALKHAIEPSPTARQRLEAKFGHAYAQQMAMSVIIATQHRDVVKLPPKDRRFSVLTCGNPMTVAQRVEIRAWMAAPENIGALYRAFLETAAVPPDVFDPLGVPPPFAGRLEMIGMAKSRIEDAYETAVDALKGFSLFTMTQAKKLVGYFGDYASGEWSNQALHTVAKNAYRLRRERIRHRGRREIIYATTDAERRRWLLADKAMIAAQLNRTEARVVHVINGGGQSDFEEQLKKTSRQSPAEEEDKD